MVVCPLLPGINAEGKASGLVKPHRLYQRLGRDEEERRLVYRALFKAELDPEVVEKIRQITNGGYVLGNARFLAQVEATLGRRSAPGKAGRPKSDAGSFDAGFGARARR